MSNTMRQPDFARHHGHTRRDFEYGLVAALVLLLLLLHLAPLSTDKDERLVLPSEPLVNVLTIEHIPPTRQYSQPVPPRPDIHIDSPEPDALADAIIVGTREPASGEGGGDSGGTRERGDARRAFVPRQILEVLPEKEGIEERGEIRLLLTIGVDGRVKRHTVLSNSTDGERGLERVLRAVYACRWEPLPEGSAMSEYTIRKRYTFD